MANNSNNKKDTDRDFRPTRGQEGNENWDDQNNSESTEKNSRRQYRFR